MYSTSICIGNLDMKCMKGGGLALPGLFVAEATEAPGISMFGELLAVNAPLHLGKCEGKQVSHAHRRWAPRLAAPSWQDHPKHEAASWQVVLFWGGVGVPDCSNSRPYGLMT